MATPLSPSPHVALLRENLAEVEQLLEFHSQIAGPGRGRKYGVEVLNKSAIVLVVACWEAFVEDLAELALTALIDNAKDHTVFPDSVLERVASKNSGLNAWKLAGQGWQVALKANLKEVLAKTTGTLNTPRVAQVDDLFLRTIGLPQLSSEWKWPRRPLGQAASALDDLVTLRGSIAHRVKHSESVLKRDVTNAIDLVRRLSSRSSNTVRHFVHQRTGVYAWRPVKYNEQY